MLMILGGPRRTAHGQQNTVQGGRVQEIWLSANGQVPGRGPSDLKSTSPGLAQQTGAQVRVAIGG